MYAMTGKLIALPGRRADFARILLRAAGVVGGLPGCRMYAVAEDLGDEYAIWVMEIWDDQATHDDSLKNEAVRALIAEGIPLMGGPPDGAGLRLVGGHGLPE